MRRYMPWNRAARSELPVRGRNAEHQDAAGADPRPLCGTIREPNG